MQCHSKYISFIIATKTIANMDQSMRFRNLSCIHEQKPPLNVHADISSLPRGLNFSLRRHQHPFIVYASSEGSDESAHMRRFA